MTPALHGADARADTRSYAMCENGGDTCLTAPAAFPPAAFPPGTPARRPPSRPPPFLPPRPAPPSFLAAGQHRRTQWVQAYPGCGCHPLAGQDHGGHDGGMSFFDGVPVPTAEPVPPWSQRPWDPPEAGFPGVVPFRTLILARTERAAVAITGLSAYSAGFEIYVTARFRPGTDTGPGGPGPRRAGTRRAIAVLPFRAAARRWHQGHRPARGPGAGWRRRAGRPHPADVPRRRQPAFQLVSLVGVAAAARRPLEFVCEWPTLGIPESRAGLDAQLILDAAGQSTRLWPDDEG